jgi:hypothetical protein
LKQREPFKRINIPELKRKQKQQTLLAHLEELIHKQAEELAQELVNSGYDSDEFTLEIRNDIDSEKLTATIYVVQVGRVLEYDLKGVEEDDTIE